jgi:antitoxin component YwqK of YwqJK toxin-antitoxin module
MTYRAGVLDGPASLYNAGRLLTELAYVAGLPEGPMRSFAASGVVATTGMLRQGRLHGEFVVYRPDGTVLQRVHYADGLLNGEALDLDVAGTVRRRSVYRAGRLDGQVTEYDAAGRAVACSEFVADRQVGERQILHGAPVNQEPWYKRWLGAA